MNGEADSSRSRGGESGAGVDLVPIDGGDEVCAGREVPVDRADTDTDTDTDTDAGAFGDVTDRRLDALLDEDRRSSLQYAAASALRWRVRIADLHTILDNLGDILARTGLETRVDRERIAVVGHSWGAQTAGAVLGARVLDADGVPGEDFSHSAVPAGALIAATGTGDTLTPFAAENLPFMKPDFSTMATPGLVIAGGKDQSQLSTRGPEWFTDAYHFSPAPKSLLTIAEAEHTMGGIAGERVAETTDEDPARVVLVADAVSAYLRAALGLDDTEWTALGSIAEDGDGTWSIASK